ncbi:MAG: hypothetical protein ACYDAC_09615 [Candidatus Dormibacteria bacterium]
MGRRPIRAALAAAAALATSSLATGLAGAAGPTTYGITPDKGRATTGITATFSFKTATAAACRTQRVRFYWDGRLWGDAATSYIAGNGTCTGDATLQPPPGATPGAHQTSAADSSGSEASTAPAPFLLLEPDGSLPPSPAPPSAAGGLPLLPTAAVGAAAVLGIGAALGLGRRRPAPRRR